MPALVVRNGHRLTKILDEVKAAGIWLTDPPARESIPSFIATRSGKH